MSEQRENVNLGLFIILGILIFCLLFSCIGYLFRPGSDSRAALSRDSNTMKAFCDPNGFGYWEKYSDSKYAVAIRMTETEYARECVR